MVRRSRALWWGSLATLLVGVFAFAGGMATALYWGSALPFASIIGPASAIQPTTPGDLRSDFKVYWETWNLVERKFYRKAPLDQKDMVYASIEGMLKSLDDEATFFQRPDVAEKNRQSMSGKFEGIGAYIEWKDAQLRVLSPMEDSPAERAGLQAGDVILAVNDAELAPILADLDANAATQKAASLIRGPQGTPVKLLILRPKSDTPFELTIVRDAVPVVTVRGKMIDGGIAYVQLTEFKATTTSELDKTLRKLIPQNPRGVILDLRNNPGGLLTSAQEVLGRFVNGGTALYEEWSNGTLEAKAILRGSNDPALFDVPMVVLVNNGSASASEIVAGALRDHDRATLVGEKTYGKGSVQSIERLSDDSSARITIAHWLTPNQHQIHKISLMPEHVVAYNTGEQYHVAFPAGRPNDPRSANDSQLWWALTMLQTGDLPPLDAAISTEATP
jgi:carboxyl-terminal processing protease